MRSLVVQLLSRYLKMSADALDINHEIDYLQNADDYLSRVEDNDAFNMEAAKNVLEACIENDDDIDGFSTSVPATRENIKTAHFITSGAINIHTGIVLGEVSSIDEAVEFQNGIPLDSVYSFQVSEDGNIDVALG